MSKWLNLLEITISALITCSHTSTRPRGQNLGLRYVSLLKLIHLNVVLDDVTFLLSTNQKPRKNLHTHTDRKVTYRARLPSLTISTASSMSKVDGFLAASVVILSSELGNLNQVVLVSVCSKFQLSSLCISFQAN